MYRIAILACILALAPSTASAAPIIAAVGAAFSWAVGVLTPIFGATAASAVVQFGVSALLSYGAMALRGVQAQKIKQSDVIRELQQPNSLPPYRFVYGECWAPGTPAPVRVKGDILYSCYILNSRPSAGPFTLFLDKREVEYTGNPYDFSGDGAIGSNEPFFGSIEDGRICQYWIGLGNQTSPPAVFLSEAPEHFSATDGWRGMTVIWLRLRAGKNERRQERWPATPPEVMVGGRWSLVWDPRKSAQSASDPSTWAWSNNQALCTLDALRQNPLKPYADKYLWLDTFSEAASIADQPVAVRGGGTIPRYRANGVLVFSQGAELEDQVQPLADAGASRFVRVGGQLGLAPGVYTPPSMTLTDILSDQGMSFTRYRSSDELVTEVSATYTSPERAYEDATTPTLVIPGAQAEDGGTPSLGQFDLRFVTDHRQAQRVAKILGMRTRMQKTITGVFPPEAFDLVGGSVVTLSLPPPYAGRNGIYEVEECHPGLDPVGMDGVAMRVALTMRETSPAVYAWDAELEEQIVTVEGFSPDMPAVQVPGAVTAISDATTALISGDSFIARVLFTFGPSPSASAIGYEWQYRQGSGLWQSGGLIDVDTVNGLGDLFGYIVPVVIGQPYTVQVRTLAPGGASDWVASSPVTASGGSFLAPPPSPVSAIGGSGEIAITFRAPNNSDYRAMEIWGADADDSGAATLLFGPMYGSANSVVTEIEDGLGSTVTRFYFAQSIDRNGEHSPFSASISATTT